MLFLYGFVIYTKNYTTFSENSQSTSECPYPFIPIFISKCGVVPESLNVWGT